MNDTNKLGYPETEVLRDRDKEWTNFFEGYLAKYYVADIVLENDESIKEGGWADPEDPTLIDFSSRGNRRFSFWRGHCPCTKRS